MNMKKIYQLRDLDCANCAAKMEHAIAQLPEVQSVSVSFLRQKMSLVLTENACLDEVMQKIIRLIKKVEPDCEVILK